MGGPEEDIKCLLEKGTFCTCDAHLWGNSETSCYRERHFTTPKPPYVPLEWKQEEAETDRQKGHKYNLGHTISSIGTRQNQLGCKKRDKFKDETRLRTRDTFWDGKSQSGHTFGTQHCSSVYEIQQSVSKSVIQSVRQTVIQVHSEDQSVNFLVSQSVRVIQKVGQWISQEGSQSVTQSVSQAVCQSVRLSVRLSVSKHHSVLESTQSI